MLGANLLVQLLWGQPRSYLQTLVHLCFVSELDEPIGGPGGSKLCFAVGIRSLA